MPVINQVNKPTNRPPKSSNGGGFFKKMNKVSGIALKVIVGILIVLSLFGFINQVAFGKDVITAAQDVAKSLSGVMSAIIKNDETSPLDVGDQGVYVRGHRPDQVDGCQEGSKSESQSGSERQE